MRAFVTGASGFIGKNLVERLILEKWSVVCLVRKNQNFGLKHKNIKVVQGDLLDKKTFESCISETDVIFHLAAGLPHHKLSDQEYWDVNVSGTQNLLEASRKTKIKRFIHVSTVGIYDISDNVISETSKLLLNDAYAISKWEAEKLVKEYAKKFATPVVIIRPTIGYGPRDIRPGFLNLFKLLQAKVFIQIGDNENFFHTIYVENLVDALILVVTKKEAVGEDFIIGDDPVMKMKDIIGTMIKTENSNPYIIRIPHFFAQVLAKFFDVLNVFGLPSPLTTRRLNFITQQRKYNINKAKQLLNYKPHINLEEGLKRTYEWYTVNGYLD